MANWPWCGCRSRAYPLLVVPVVAVDDRIFDRIATQHLPKAQIRPRFITRVQPSTVDQVVGTIGYVVRLYVRIQSLDGIDRQRIESERVGDRPAIRTRSTQGGGHVGVDGVGVAAAPYRVAAAAAEDHIRLVAVGYVVVAAVAEDVVLAAHRKDPVISRAAKNPI